MFLGLSFLTVKLQVVPTETKTVISQVGRAIFGAGRAGLRAVPGAPGRDDADPDPRREHVVRRLPSPGELPRRGQLHAPAAHRRAAIAWSSRTGSSGSPSRPRSWSSLFKADVSKLIPFYAIGVFTSFTLSQAGMSKRHLRLREPGWRVGLAINGLGRDHDRRRDGRDRRDEVRPRRVGRHGLRPGDGAAARADEPSVRARGRGAGGRPAPARRRTQIQRPIVVLLVEAFDAKMVHALGYAKTIRAEQIHGGPHRRRPADDARAGDRVGVGGTERTSR